MASRGQSAPASAAEERARVGLCADCTHARRLTSAKGSVFYRCARAADDPAFPDYPPLPVRACPGHAAAAAADDA